MEGAPVRASTLPTSILVPAFTRPEAEFPELKDAVSLLAECVILSGCSAASGILLVPADHLIFLPQVTVKDAPSSILRSVWVWGLHILFPTGRSKSLLVTEVQVLPSLIPVQIPVPAFWQLPGEADRQGKQAEG